MCQKCLERNLATLTIVAEKEFDQGGNIREFLRRISIIRTDMQALGSMGKQVYEIENVMAEFQPYLIQPFFMAE